MNIVQRYIQSNEFEFKFYLPHNKEKFIAVVHNDGYNIFNIKTPDKKEYYDSRSVSGNIYYGAWIVVDDFNEVK